MASRERGSIAVEMAVFTIPVIALMLLVAVGGRVYTAKAQVQGAARDAARAASMSRGDARADGTAAADQTLRSVGLTCERRIVSINPRAPKRGQPVAATVTCFTRLSDLGLPGANVDKRITATVVSPVDTYVGR